MKKWFLLILSLFFAFSVVACVKDTTTTTTTTSSTTTTTTTTTTTSTTTTSNTTTTTTTEVEDVLTSVTIHYFDEFMDYDNVALWLWAQGVDGAQYDFEGVDFYGAYLTLDLTQGEFEGWENIGFIVKLADSWTGQSVDFTIDTMQAEDGVLDAYVVKGGTTVSYEYEAPDATKLIIHLNKSLAMIEELNLKVWGQDSEGNWLDDTYFDFTHEDAYGAYVIIDLVEFGRATIGFGITPGTQWIPETVQVDSVDLTKVNLDGEVHLYMVSGGETFTYGWKQADVSKISMVIHYVPTTSDNAVSGEITKLFDDFTRPIIDRDGVSYTGNVSLTPRVSYLSVNYNETTGTSADASIYKAASAANTTGSYAYLVFVMKSSNGASINDLKLAFRYDDNHALIELDFTSLLDPDLETLPELTSDYQMYIISIADTLDGMSYVGNGTYPNVAATGSIVGFHLYADGASSGTLDISEVYFSSDAVTIGFNSNTDYLVDNFQRVNVNTAPSGIYWCGSVGEIVGKWLLLDATSSTAIYEDHAVSVEGLENVLITLRGSVDGADLTVTPVYDTEGVISYGTPALLSTLLNPDGVAISTLSTSFSEVCISLSLNGWDSNLIGLKLEVAQNIVTIDQIQYITYVSGAEPTYPVLDSESVKAFDNFNRATVGATSAYTTDNPVAAENNLYYIISYTDSEALGKLYIEDNALVFDCTEDTGYINFVEASKSGNLGTHKYVVFKMKVDEGGSFANFRFQTSTSGVVWANDLLAANGMSSLSTSYTTPDGWSYIVVDLELNGLFTSFEELTLYYSGSGRLLVDSIFFANDDYVRLNLAEKTVADVFDYTQVYTAGDDYQYNYIELSSQNPLGQRYMVIVLKGDGLENFRFQTYEGDNTSSVKYITDLKGIGGYPYQLTDFGSDEYRYLIIDLVESGLNLHPEGIHLHLNNAKVYIAEIFYADEMLPAIISEPTASFAPVTPFVIDASAVGYAYNYVSVNGSGDYLELVVKGNMASLRFQVINSDESITSSVVFLADLIGRNGLPLSFQEQSDDYQVLLIDLAKSGLPTDISGLHVHYGDETDTDILTIQSISIYQLVDTTMDHANEVVVYQPETPQVIDASAAEYVYTYIYLTTPITGNRYLTLVVKGDVTSIRFEAIKADSSTAPVKWIHELIGVDGNPVSYVDNSDDYQTITIDLVASGIGTDITAFHFHYGNATDTDILTIQEFISIPAFDNTALIEAALNQ